MNAPLQPLHLQIDGTALTLLVPEPGTVQRQYRQQQEAGMEPEAPFWSRVWPSAFALADWIARHPERMQGKAVLELAAGLGLPSFWAARTAASVTGSDFLPEAVALLAQNAAALGLENYHARLLDWNGLPDDLSADILLLSDINYTPSAFPALQAMIGRFLSAGTEILLATPQRAMGAPFIEAISGDITWSEAVQVEGTAVRIYGLERPLR